jgi:hypothetical protein
MIRPRELDEPLLPPDDCIWNDRARLESPLDVTPCDCEPCIRRLIAAPPSPDELLYDLIREEDELPDEKLPDDRLRDEDELEPLPSEKLRDELELLPDEKLRDDPLLLLPLDWLDCEEDRSRPLPRPCASASAITTDPKKSPLSVTASHGCLVNMIFASRAHAPPKRASARDSFSLDASHGRPDEP